MADFQKLINSEKPVLVDFYADWCGPCQMMPPILKEVSSKMGDQAKVVKVDVDKNQKAAQAYGVKGVPTLMIFKDGEIKWQRSGVAQADELESVIKQYV